MSILGQLSSQVGDRTEASNRKVIAQCLANPALLNEVAQGLKSGNAALMGDCAEVLTEVAEEHPEWVAPYAKVLAAHLAHRNTRVRWEATHALALVATLAPAVLASVLAQLAEALRRDASTIVRDYTVDALGNYAGTGPEAAQVAYPLLKEALTVWEGKHAHHALRGLGNVASVLPDLTDDVRALAEQYLTHSRGVVRHAAKALLQVVKTQ